MIAAAASAAVHSATTTKSCSTSASATIIDGDDDIVPSTKFDPADHHLDDDSSVTMSDTSSSSSDEVYAEESNVNALPIPLSSSANCASLPGRTRGGSGLSFAFSTKSCPLHRRSASSQPASLPALFASLHSLSTRFGKDDALVARTWNLIGNAHYREHNFRSALSAYKEAVMCGALGAHTAEACFNLGRVYLDFGLLRESTDCLVQSLHTHEFFAVALGRDLGKSRDVATVHLHLGVALTRQGRYELAMQALDLARDIYENIHCHVQLAQTIVAMGKIYLICDDAASALLCREDAQKVLLQREP